MESMKLQTEQRLLADAIEGERAGFAILIFALPAARLLCFFGCTTDLTYVHFVDKWN